MYDCNNKSTKKQVNKTVSNMESELASSLLAQMVKNLPAMKGTWVQSLGWKDPLEKGMVTHSSIFA